LLDCFGAVVNVLCSARSSKSGCTHIGEFEGLRVSSVVVSCYVWCMLLFTAVQNHCLLRLLCAG